jgi:ectoine hydroxylase-related dioxygenase (phytanoyl-CoA dioxygenase family)
LGLGVKHGFREIVMRSPGRYELSLLHMQGDQVPDTSRILEPLQTLLPTLLGGAHSSIDQLKLCHLSLLVSTPGSAEQGWHADGGHVSITKHLPCHCYNIFIPLQDVPLEMGPTEFRPGGHFLTRNLGPMMLAAKCRKTLRPPVWPPLQLGDAVLFDYRVLHRGKANTSTTVNRNVLVMTFCEPWFQDILNFPKRSMMMTEPANENNIETVTTTT